MESLIFTAILMIIPAWSFAGPRLVYSTYIDSAKYVSYLDNNGFSPYAADTDPEGNLYFAGRCIADQKTVRVWRLSTSGNKLEKIIDLPGYLICQQLDWRESGLYVRLVSEDANIGEEYVRVTPEGKIIYHTNIGYNMEDYSFNHNYIDRDGNLYLALTVHPQDTALIETTDDAFDTNPYGEADIVIQKYDPSGNLVYGSFWGGSENDVVWSFTCDDNGRMYINGYTESDDFPIEYENPEATKTGSEVYYILTISPEFDEFRIYHSGVAFYRDRIQIINDKIYKSDTTEAYICSLAGEPLAWLDMSESYPFLRDIPFCAKPTISRQRSYTPSLFDEQGGLFNVRHSWIDMQFFTTPDALFSEPLGDSDITIWHVTFEPEVLYGTYFGGTGSEITFRNTIVYRDGIVYVTGFTNSADFPTTPGAYRENPTVAPGEYEFFAFALDFNQTTEVAEDLSVAPDTFILDPPHPNPFNPETTISFTLPDAGDIRLAIYDISGQKVRELAAGQLSAGRHEFVWDGCDQNGDTVSSGVYFCRLLAGENVAVRKVALVR